MHVPISGEFITSCIQISESSRQRSLPVRRTTGRQWDGHSPGSRLGLCPAVLSCLHACDGQSLISAANHRPYKARWPPALPSHHLLILPGQHCWLPAFCLGWLVCPRCMCLSVPHGCSTNYPKLGPSKFTPPHGGGQKHNVRVSAGMGSSRSSRGASIPGPLQVFSLEIRGSVPQCVHAPRI